MAFFIVFQAIGLSLVGLPFALGVAVLAGVLEVIPLLGTVVGLTLGLSLAATVSGHLVVMVLVIFVVGRALQDNFVNPYVFSQSLEMPPTLVIVALLVGAELMGLMGALIAVPLLATLQVLVQNLYVAPMVAKEQAQPAEAIREAVPLGVTFAAEQMGPAEPGAS
jgi:predicted PurR-regulated permease PerM